MTRWGPLALGALVLLALLALPLALGDPFFQHLCIQVFMWTVLGAAWNILGGFAGQVSFGHAAFFGMGAYTTIILFLRAGLPPWWGIPLGGVTAALLSLPIGLLCFRLRGPYFSLSTLAAAEIVRLVALNWERVTNGPVGFLITTLPPLRFGGKSVDWESKAPFYVTIALLLVFALAATAWLKHSRIGAFLVAIRENEDAAEAVGIDTVRAKVLTLVLSSFLCGMGGGFYAFYYRYVDPDAVLSIALSMEMVFIAMIGGLGSVGGPLIGAVVLTTIGENVREHFPSGHLVFYGLFMMIVIRYMPEGIWGRVYRWLPWTRTKAKVAVHGAPGDA